MQISPLPANYQIVLNQDEVNVIVASLAVTLFNNEFPTKVEILMQEIHNTLITNCKPYTTTS